MKKKISKGVYIAGTISILSALAGVAVILCAGFMVESGDFSAVIKTAAVGALMCVPMAILQKLCERR